MRIGIEACTYANRRGYGRFTRGLVGAMVSDFPQHEFVLLVDQHTAATCSFPEGARLQVVQTGAQPTEAASADGSRSPADLLRMSLGASRLDVDLFLFPSNYSYFPLFRRLPVVTVFHDATDVLHPELLFGGFRSRSLWRLKCWLARRQSRRIATVSHDAARQIAEGYRVPLASIHVVTEGPDPVFCVVDEPEAFADVRARLALPADEPLVLYVGGISPHKNLDGLLGAMVRLVERPWHLVLVGDYAGDSFLGCHDELVERARTLGIAERVTFTGFVSDEDLALLYNTASLLVLPSMNEGFGLPVVEAMASGLPVAVSDRSSLPEVCGEAGLLFDPKDEAAIAAQIGRLLDDPGLRDELGRAGLERAELFSWGAAATKMVALLEELAGARR